MYSVYHGDPPFYILGVVDTNVDYLGGSRSMRGYISRRFTGNVVSLFNFEIRETLANFILFKQNFTVMLAAFIDVGRVFDTVEDTRLEDYRAGYGAGLRLSWNEATIIFFDAGFSEEGYGIYIDFQHMF